MMVLFLSHGLIFGVQSSGVSLRLRPPDGGLWFKMADAMDPIIRSLSDEYFAKHPEGLQISRGPQTYQI